MDRDQAMARGRRLRAYIEARLPLGDTRSPTGLAKRIGIRPNTMTNWWAKGTTPDQATLKLVADELGVDLGDLIQAIEGPSPRPRVLSDPDLEALLERAARRGAQLALDDLSRTDRSDRN